MYTDIYQKKKVILESWHNESSSCMTRGLKFVTCHIFYTSSMSMFFLQGRFYLWSFGKIHERKTSAQGRIYQCIIHAWKILWQIRPLYSRQNVLNMATPGLPRDFRHSNLRDTIDKGFRAFGKTFSAFSTICNRAFVEDRKFLLFLIYTGKLLIGVSGPALQYKFPFVSQFVFPPPRGVRSCYPEGFHTMGSGDLGEVERRTVNLFT